MDKVLAVLIGCPIAFLIILYRRPIKEFIGNIGFAERYLGQGGTNTFVLLLGILLFILCLMYASGSLQSILNNSLGRFF